LNSSAFIKVSSIKSPSRSAIFSTMSDSSNTNFKLLVLGGTGFVGREVVKKARDKGYTVISLSRRGKLTGETDKSVTWVSGDASEAKTVTAILDDFGPFDGCIHAVGLLLDVDSGLSALNKFASGSGSAPGLESTYDRVTRQTGFTIIDCLSAKAALSNEGPKPFVFVSAAEAGWTQKSPVAFLERYLIAKRAVEEKALASSVLRTIILRPSLIWTKEKPAAFLSVIPFFIGNYIGLPFIDKPVQLSTLVDTALSSLEDTNIQGILRYTEMEKIAGVSTN